MMELEEQKAALKEQQDLHLHEIVELQADLDSQSEAEKKKEEVAKMNTELSELKEKHSNELQQLKKAAVDEHEMELSSLREEHDNRIKEVHKQSVCVCVYV